MIVSSEQELDTLRQCGRNLAAVLDEVVGAVKPGISTKEIDKLAEARILSLGGCPVFKGYRSTKKEPPFPASTCISINDEVVHGIPREDRILKTGDIVSIDFGMRYPAEGGLITDVAVTVPVGRVSSAARRLLEVTREALEISIKKVKAGTHLGDIGSVIQDHIEENGFSVIRELMGHGVGRNLHELPNVPNYGEPGNGAILKDNVVLAIEPMAATGGPAVKPDADGWTWRTIDGGLAAHFEHTVLVTREGAEILTKI